MPEHFAFFTKWAEQVNLENLEHELVDILDSKKSFAN
jgi:hypothetical protein